MRLRASSQNYRNATLAIYAAMHAANRPTGAFLQRICRSHKISVNYPSMLRERGYLVGKGKTSFWNPERNIPDDKEVEALRQSTLLKMSSPKKGVEKEPGQKERVRVGGVVAKDLVEQEDLPLTPSSEYIDNLVQIHRSTGDLLRELGVAV